MNVRKMMSSVPDRFSEYVNSEKIGTSDMVEIGK